VATRDHFGGLITQRSRVQIPPPQPLFLQFIQRISSFCPVVPTEFRHVRTRAGHAVEPRCKLRGSRPPRMSSSRVSGASGTSRDRQRSPAPIQFERAKRCNWAQVLGTACQREGVDGDAPVDAQNAPTGACKTAPNQNAVSHTVHNPSSFLLPEKPQLLTCRRKANVLARRA
jgi:hypothetical protein